MTFAPRSISSASGGIDSSEPNRFARRFLFAGRFFAVAVACFSALAAFGADKKVLLIAGRPSHAPGAHEYNAGMLLLQKCLSRERGLTTTVVRDGWPTDPDALHGVDAIVVFSDGGAKHPLLAENRLAAISAAVDRGAGIGLMHYAVEPTLPQGHQEFLDWIGGTFEVNWSVNPHWEAEFAILPDHPVTRGLQPFKLLDEWYFHLRFVEGMKGVTPLLVARAPASTMARPNGTHSGNAAVRAAVARGEAQTLAWVFDRPDGGRGFGFTGGHYHPNWGDGNFRTLVLNAILWLARMDVPVEGFVSKVTNEDLRANLDVKPERTPKAGRK